jgi:hypothetical protein
MHQNFGREWIAHVNRILRDPEALPQPPPDVELFDVASGYTYSGKEGVRAYIARLGSLGRHRLSLLDYHGDNQRGLAEYVLDSVWTHPSLRTDAGETRRSRAVCSMQFEFGSDAPRRMRSYMDPEIFLSRAAYLDRVPAGLCPPPQPLALRSESTETGPQPAPPLPLSVSSPITQPARRLTLKKHFGVVMGGETALTGPLAHALETHGENCLRVSRLGSYSQFVNDVRALGKGTTLYWLLQGDPGLEAYDNLSQLKFMVGAEATAIIGSGVRQVVLVTDFMTTEIDGNHTRQLGELLNWNEDVALKKLKRMPFGLAKRALAYHTMVFALRQAGIVAQRVHAGLVIGDAQSGQFEHNARLERLLERFIAPASRALPPDNNWLPMITADFAAKLLARLPQIRSNTAEALWLFDPRTPPLAELATDIWHLKGESKAPPKLPSWVFDELHWTGLPALLGAEQPEGMIQHQYANSALRSRVQQMGLEWPDTALAFRHSAEFLLRAQGRIPTERPTPNRIGSEAGRRNQSLQPEPLSTF